MGRGTVTIQVLEGVDKGRIFQNLPVPVTMGREEGNVLRLNDDRVSRFHSKLQLDDDDFILTDLESTNGTRVNGNVVQIRRLRIGDRIGIGRSLLLFGSNEEIAARIAQLHVPPQSGTKFGAVSNSTTGQLPTLAGEVDSNLDFDLNPDASIHATRDALFIGSKALPPLPLKLTPSQAARLAEILGYLHQGLTQATDRISANEESGQVILQYADWQRTLAIQMLLARYLRMIADPPEISD